MMHHCLIHPSRYFEEGASCPECAALPPVRSEPLLAIEAVLDEMSRIISEHPAAMEYETDARDTWPKRWGALLGYLKAKRDIANIPLPVNKKG